MDPHAPESLLTQKCRELPAMMDAMQQGLRNHLPLAGCYRPVMKDFDFIPVAGFRFGYELPKLLARVFAHGE